MNKLIIVGHPLSNYQQVETLLKQCGMQTALPSRREGLIPNEVASILCKEYQLPQLETISSDNQIQQLNASPLWHEMALDLMIGNIEQQLWGWADPNSIYLLEYWKELDQHITFILAYNSPQSILTALPEEEMLLLSTELLIQRLSNWYSYNNVLLHFYNNNPERCFLVHTEQAIPSAKTYLEQLKSHIASKALNVDCLNFSDSLLNNNNEIVITASEEVVNKQTSSIFALKHYLANDLVQQHPASVKLYNELQKIANLPLLTSKSPSALAAWHSVYEIRTHIRQLELVQLNNEQEKQQLVAQLDNVIDELENNKLQIQEHQQLLNEKIEAEARARGLLADAEKALAEAKAQVVIQIDAEQEQESEILFTQLNKVQLELEDYYLKYQQQNQTLAEKLRLEEEMKALLAQKEAMLEEIQLASDQKEIALEAAKQQLAEKEKLVEKAKEYAVHKSNDLSEAKNETNHLIQQKEHENQQLLTQLNQAQKSLKNYYAKFHEANKQLAENSRILSEKNHQLDQQEQHIAQKDLQLTQKEQQLIANQQQLTQKNQQLAEQEKLVEQNKALIQRKDQALAEARFVLNEKEFVLVDLINESKNKEKLLAETQHKMEQLTHQLNIAKQHAAFHGEQSNESELLLLELQKLQEKLEYYYLENEKLRQNK